MIDAAFVKDSFAEIAGDADDDMHSFVGSTLPHPDRAFHRRALARFPVPPNWWEIR